MINGGHPKIVRIADHPGSLSASPRAVSPLTLPASSVSCFAGDPSCYVDRDEKLQDAVVIDLMQTAADLSRKLGRYEALDREMKRRGRPNVVERSVEGTPMLLPCPSPAWQGQNRHTPRYDSVEGTPILRPDGMLPPPRRLYRHSIEMENRTEVEESVRELVHSPVPHGSDKCPLEGEFREALRQLTQAQARVVRHIHHHGYHGLAIGAVVGALLSGLVSTFFIWDLLLRFHLSTDNVVRLGILGCVSFAILGALIGGTIGFVLTRQHPLKWKFDGRLTDEGPPCCKALPQADLNFHDVLASLLIEEREALLSHHEHRELRALYAKYPTEIHLQVSHGAIPSPTLPHVVQQAREMAHAERHRVWNVLGDCWL